MPKYVLHLEISAVRVPDAEVRDLKPGGKRFPKSDSRRRADKYRAPAHHFQRSAGNRVHWIIPVTAESFAALCELLARFDDLAERVECEHP